MQLSKDTFRFLRDLNENNNREWFQENKGRYEEAREDVKNLVGHLIMGLAAFDPEIPIDIPVDKCLFRIYRDIRFRKDKTPYKTWLGAGISVDGRKLQGPEYYLHIQPDHSFIASGYWRPQKEHLAAIRQEIDYNGTELTQILDSLKKHPQPLAPDQEDQLKRPPSGYEADHPHIDYLKLKSFTLSQSIPDAQWCKPNTVADLLESYRRMYPFKLFLHRAIDGE